MFSTVLQDPGIRIPCDFLNLPSCLILSSWSKMKFITMCSNSSQSDGSEGGQYISLVVNRNMLSLFPINEIASFISVSTLRSMIPSITDLSIPDGEEVSYYHIVLLWLSGARWSSLQDVRITEDSLPPHGG
ncbi:hypothetical protein Tco_0424690 [Tanacetum coccineum]